LVIHELATNSAKYGALSVPEGQIELTTSVDGDVRITWQERGGPPIASAPTEFGFGSRLSEISIEQQLGGKLVRSWDPEGLTVRIDVAKNRLSRG
jgi:two-component sensor histidine kinase